MTEKQLEFARRFPMVAAIAEKQRREALEVRAKTKAQAKVAHYWLDVTVKQLIKSRARQHAERTASFCYMAAQSAN